MLTLSLLVMSIPYLEKCARFFSKQCFHTMLYPFNIVVVVITAFGTDILPL